MPTNVLLHRRAALALAGLGLALPRLARAATWPEHTITIVAPFTPGGPVDVLARVFAQGVQARTGRNAIVDNRVGAQGNIGLDIVKRATPDGHTLLLVPAGNLTINPTLMSNFPFDIQKDFAPIGIIATAPNVIVCNPTLPAKNISELVAYAKKQPHGVTFASPGVGSQLHLAGEMLAKKLGIEMLHIPYKGSSQAATDLASGQVDLLFTNLPSVLGMVQAGQLRALALTTATRAPTAPEIPTLEEQGVAGFDITSWYGLMAPHATPQPVQAAIHDTLDAVLADPSTLEKLKAQGLTVVKESMADFDTRIQHETAAWAEVIRAGNIQSGL